MRKITILAASAALAFATAGVHAQSTQAPAPAPAQTPEAAPEAPGAAAPAITSVTVVDIQELPEATQEQVNQAVEQGGTDHLDRLRASIDGMPELKSALEARGATSADVIAASMGEGGALTLITKKAS